MSDSAVVRDLLDYLQLALGIPEVARYCLEKSDAVTLDEFSRWAHARRCKRCGAAVPLRRMTTCSEKCRLSIKRSNQRQRRIKQLGDEARQRRRATYGLHAGLRGRRAADSAARREMLAFLRYAVDYPEVVERCLEKSGAESLRGFSHWLLSRRCKRCNAPLPPEELKVCSDACRRSLQRGAEETQKFKADRSWSMFAQRVIRPLPIEVVAEKLNVSVEDARARAATDAGRGRLLVYRNRAGEISEVGKPTGEPPRRMDDVRAARRARA